jgi:hypothetical protein
MPVIGNFMTQRNLLLILAALIGLKFALSPLVSWQNAKVDELSFKRNQAAKINDIASNKFENSENLEALRASIVAAEDYFYVDDDATKLAIQRDLEELFIRNELVVTGFNWVVDTPSSIRSLRATLFFKGSQKNMITTFLNIAMWPKIIKVVEWSQQMRSYQPKELGSTQGFVTLEFYALNPTPDIMPAPSDKGSLIVEPSVSGAGHD